MSIRKFGGGGENCTPDDLLCGQTPCCLGYAAFDFGMSTGMGPYFQPMIPNAAAMRTLPEATARVDYRFALSSVLWRDVAAPLSTGDGGHTFSVFLLNLLPQSRQDISGAHLAELRHALAHEEPNALSPLHGMGDLFHQQRLDGLRCIVDRVWLSSGVGYYRSLRSSKRHRRQKISECLRGICHIS